MTGWQGSPQALAAPGDVLAVWTSSSLAARLIRAGEALRGEPAVANHVVILTHRDKLGRWIGIEGRPGGVAVCDCTRYLTSSLTRSNHAQPGREDPAQLARFLASCAKSLGIAYDWVGIAEDSLDAAGVTDMSRVIDPLWRWPVKSGLMPGHVVCSSLAAELYGIAGWPHPDLGTERVCMPADWWSWSDSQQWKAKP